jgi:hypothetical protein
MITMAAEAGIALLFTYEISVTDRVYLSNGMIR